MIAIKVICVGKLKEKYFKEAAEEYLKRLAAYCKIEIEELREVRLSEKPSQQELATALKEEGDAITAKLPAGAAVIALCVEGELKTSEALSAFLGDLTVRGTQKMVFIIGGSFGLHTSVKARASLKLSLSPMTFPHHLARVMLLEQIYRSFKIAEGGKYHK